MNKMTSQKSLVASREEVEQAARLIKTWLKAQNNPESEVAADIGLQLVDADRSGRYPAFSRTYDQDFSADGDYIATLPDLQNSDHLAEFSSTIQHVGISNFRLPLRYRLPSGGHITLETSVAGTVRLDADKRGINMSRIMRSFYRHAERSFSFDVISEALSDYLTDLDSTTARIHLAFSYPVKIRSLRSGLEGYQYYNISLEQIASGPCATNIVHLDYVYSSTCPCSLELSEHARMVRGQLATPHSQRSVARVSVVLAKDTEELWFEDLVKLCRKAVPTETQVMVKREDEQAFAELNAANPIFVEDAVRAFAKELSGDPRIGDFRVVASHQESLHSHDAVSLLTEGPTFATESLEPQYFKSLYHVG
ncbi:GTP cyclohydrolase FolE2 [Oceaniovalibus sp. ACAM 378]|uniref:GTP cyclohydrolase FolE2 n=1 Tax=Oceaniovalibus sp. ACAM 378 TaxID=2599923 RepID=UPI0011DA469F|nr:GTP cyclohydrolase FolE2 [Oceaniovalibus sp. ACAM 378]TYB84933.1 GTP cyclohydrolase I FolE2 [Oceaniovalibus sp. ACAM 378]